MIESFFRVLKEREVGYLLISGQATVLYGAATFSEDLDLWVEPSSGNLDRLAHALRDVQASYYKLTPPLRHEFAERGHGFHFVLPDDVYLDVMCKPPRVGPFAEAFQAANHLETAWGNLPVVGIPDLVELKKTQRVEDYPIISKLTLSTFQHGAPPEAHLIWAAENVFTAESVEVLFRVLKSAEPVETALADLFTSWQAGDEDLDEVYDAILHHIDGKRATCQRADRLHWKAIIEELRALRRDAKLMTSGQRI